MKYLYIYDGLDVFQHQEPTAEDYKAVEEGILQIYIFVNGRFKYYCPDSDHPTKFEEVPRGEIRYNEKSNDLYHAPTEVEPEESKE